MKKFLWWGILGFAIGFVFWQKIVSLNIPGVSSLVNNANTAGAGGNTPT